MDALDVVMVCIRRWWVMLPVLGLSALAGLGLVHQQKPVFHAFGSYALVYTHGDNVPVGGIDPRSANPLAENQGSLIGEALIADYMSELTQEQLGRPGTTGSAPDQAADDTLFSVTLPAQGTSAYQVQSWGPKAADVRAVVEGVLSSAPGKATRIQDRAGAPKNSQYTTFVTSPTQVAPLPPGSTAKLLGAVVGAGVLAGAALSVVVDRLLQRRKQRAATAPRERSSRFRPRAASWPRRRRRDHARQAGVPESPDAGREPLEEVFEQVLEEGHQEGHEDYDANREVLEPRVEDGKDRADQRVESAR